MYMHVYLKQCTSSCTCTIGDQRTRYTKLFDKSHEYTQNVCLGVSIHKLSYTYTLALTSPIFKILTISPFITNLYHEYYNIMLSLFEVGFHCSKSSHYN